MPVTTGTQRLIMKYLEAAGRKDDVEGPLFRSVKNNVTGTLVKPLHPNSVYEKIVRRYACEVGITTDVHGFCIHSLHSTAATNALEHAADIRQGAGMNGSATPASPRRASMTNAPPAPKTACL